MSFVEAVTPPSSTAEMPTDMEVAAAKILRVIDACGMRRHGSSAITRQTCRDELATGQEAIDKIARGEFEFGGRRGAEIGVSLDEMRKYGFIIERGEDKAFDLNALIESWEGFKTKTDEHSFFARR